MSNAARILVMPHNCYLKTSSPLSILSSLEIKLYSNHLFITFPVFLTFIEEHAYVPVMFKDISSTTSAYMASSNIRTL